MATDGIPEARQGRKAGPPSVIKRSFSTKVFFYWVETGELGR